MTVACAHDGGVRTCPQCAEDIPESLAKCTRCGESSTAALSVPAAPPKVHPTEVQPFTRRQRQLLCGLLVLGLLPALYLQAYLWALLSRALVLGPFIYVLCLKLDWRDRWLLIGIITVGAADAALLRQ